MPQAMGRSGGVVSSHLDETTADARSRAIYQTREAQQGQPTGDDRGMWRRSTSSFLQQDMRGGNAANRPNSNCGGAGDARDWGCELRAAGLALAQLLDPDTAVNSASNSGGAGGWNVALGRMKERSAGRGRGGSRKIGEHSSAPEACSIRKSQPEPAVEEASTPTPSELRLTREALCGGAFCEERGALRALPEPSELRDSRTALKHAEPGAHWLARDKIFLPNEPFPNGITQYECCSRAETGDSDEPGVSASERWVGGWSCGRVARIEDGRWTTDDGTSG